MAFKTKFEEELCKEIAKRTLLTLNPNYLQDTDYEGCKCPNSNRFFLFCYFDTRRPCSNTNELIN